MALCKERANELLIKTINKYVALADNIGNSQLLNNEQISSDIGIGKKELKELGLNYNNRRREKHE